MFGYLLPYFVYASKEGCSKVPLILYFSSMCLKSDILALIVCLLIITLLVKEHSCSVVECSARDLEDPGSSLT